MTPENDEYMLVLSTCPDMGCAEKVSGQLVDNALAACVNIIPGLRSVYVWKGERKSENEVLLLIKTRHGKMDALRETILDCHPYELPEIIALPITDGLPGYLSWINARLEAQN